MANKSIFQSYRGQRIPATGAVNEAGGIAYRLESRHALAQYAATGCLNGTFYAGARVQLEHVLRLCERVAPEFIARTALYARQRGLMKDLPALLCAVLSVRGPGLLAEVFDRVIDTPKMLRNFVQIMRSGAVGRKSLGTLPKRLVLQWLESRTDGQLFIGSVGADPSLADIVKMVHPKPQTASRAALLGWLIGRPYETDALPPIVRAFEAFKAAGGTAPNTPDVPLQMLTALKLSKEQWKSIARRASWQTTRMNLNAFARHGVFDDRGIVEAIADKLRDPQSIRQSPVLPYQLMMAWTSASATLPPELREALQDAMDVALANVPRIDDQVYVFPDVSGSMHSPITGRRHGSSSAVRCIDVAALIAAALLRTNRGAVVVPFESKAIPPERLRLNARDSVMTNAARLASLPAGGTNCSAPLEYLNARKASGDLVIYVSDNESWIDTPLYGRCGGSATKTMKEWSAFKRRNRQARMVCIDLQPYATTQAAERDDIINVGGFSDQVFELIAAVAGGEATAGYWVRQIEAVRL